MKAEKHEAAFSSPGEKIIQQTRILLQMYVVYFLEQNIRGVRHNHPPSPPTHTHELLVSMCYRY